MPRRPPIDRPKKRLTHEKLRQDFDEESASDEENFQSVSTDNQTTNYNLEYTSQTLKSQKGKTSQTAARTPRKATPVRSALKRTSTTVQEDASTSERLRNRSEQQSVASPRRESTTESRVQTRSSPSKNTSRVRFSEVEADDSESEESQPARQPTRTTSESSQRQSTKNVAKERPSTSGKQNQSQQKARKQKNPKKNTPLLKEIRRLQNSVDTLIPKLSFSRVIRETLMQHSDMGMRITLVALQALQEASELYLVQLFEDSYRCTQHRNRVTLTVKDMELVRFLRGPCDPGNN